MKKGYLFISSMLALQIGAMAQYGMENYVSVYAHDTQSEIIAKAATLTPSLRQLRWQKLELTAFFHFGINTFTDKDWGNGKENPQIFNPTELDANQWIRTIKKAGFKQVIITAKHHDGFCLWPSKYTEHSVKNSLWKNGKGDVVKEVADACRKYGIGFGIYLSPWDRNAAVYGSEAYNDFFMNQLNELLTQYGQIDEVWFDGANGEGPNGKKQVYDFGRWYALIRKLQPGATIAIMGPDVRWVGTESGKGRETEWSVLPVSERSQETIAAASQKEINVMKSVMGSAYDSIRGSREQLYGCTGLIWYPAETDVSIRPQWFYHESENDKVKSPETLMNIYFTSVGMNGVLLLNIPPDKRGLLSDYDIKSLMGFKQKMDKTFKNNLLKHALLRSDNGRNTKNLVDGDYSSYYTTNNNDSTTVIHISLPEEKNFNVFCLQENIAVGQRIEKFELEYKAENGWISLFQATTAGYKRLIRFNEVTARELRLKILSARLNPAISEIGLYKLAE